MRAAARANDDGTSVSAHVLAKTGTAYAEDKHIAISLRLLAALMGAEILRDEGLHVHAARRPGGHARVHVVVVPRRPRQVAPVVIIRAHSERDAQTR